MIGALVKGLRWLSGAPFLFACRGRPFGGAPYSLAQPPRSAAGRSVQQLQLPLHEVHGLLAPGQEARAALALHSKVALLPSLARVAPGPFGIMTNARIGRQCGLLPKAALKPGYFLASPCKPRLMSAEGQGTGRLPFAEAKGAGWLAFAEANGTGWITSAEPEGTRSFLTSPCKPWLMSAEGQSAGRLTFAEAVGAG